MLPVVTHHYCQITVETQCVESQEAWQQHEDTTAAVLPAFWTSPDLSLNGTVFSISIISRARSPRVDSGMSLRILLMDTQHHSQGGERKNNREKQNKTTTRKTFQKRCPKSEHSAERGFLRSESWPGSGQEIGVSCLQRKRRSAAPDQKQTALQLNKQRTENFSSSRPGSAPKRGQK